MFKFDFDLDADDEPSTTTPTVLTSIKPEESAEVSEVEEIPQAPLIEHSLVNLLSHLPPHLSHSPLYFASAPNPIARRDLFDARFQRAVQDAAEDEEDESHWGPETDLVKGVYEGGLKTWECAGDLVGVLAEEGGDVEGQTVYEIGCGTAIPTVSLISKLLERPEMAADRKPTHFYLLDYNALVLQLVTLPNILLAFRHLVFPPSTTNDAEAAGPSSEAHRSPPKDDDEGDDDEDDLPTDTSLPVPQAVQDRFIALLASHQIHLHFYSGAWSHALALAGTPKQLPKADLILTSETIYQASSVPTLLALLRALSFKKEEDETERTTRILVAAKVLYFGLEGGGVEAFLGAVRQHQGWGKEVWRSGMGAGVGRWVGEVGWH